MIDVTSIASIAPNVQAIVYAVLVGVALLVSPVYIATIVLTVTHALDAKVAAIAPCVPIAPTVTIVTVAPIAAD